MINIYGDSWINCGSPGKPYVGNYSSGAMNVGQVRYNTSTQNLETYDGNSWVSISGGSASISMSGRATDVLIWAEQQMRAQQELQEKAKNSPTVADALAKYQEAADQLKVVLALTDK